MARRALLVSTLAFSLWGCGPTDKNGDGIADGVRDPNSVSLVAPSTPVGTVSGQVLDTRLKPLPEAQVSLTVGGVTGAADAPLVASTAADGTFFFKAIPAGAQVLTTITKGGFATVRAVGAVPSAAGNFPINNGNLSVGPYTLTQLNGSFKVQLVTRSGKTPKGVRAVLEASPAGTLVTSAGTYGVPQGVVVVDGTSDDLGQIAFAGIPGIEELSRLSGSYDVTVGAFDENADGVPEFAGTFRSFTGRSLLLDPSTRVIELPDARSTQPLTVIATNIESIITPGSAPSRNMIRSAGEAISVVFNQPVLDASVVVRLSDEFGVKSMVISKELKAGNTALLIRTTEMIASGQEYNLSIRATSADNGSIVSRAAYFFGGDPAVQNPMFSLTSIQYRDTPPPNNNNALNAGEVVVFNFNQPIKLIGGAPVESFVDYDFNQSGMRGDITGEKGAPTGFQLAISEPVAEPNRLFDLQPSGYSSRYVYTFSGATVGVPNTTPVSAAFSKLLNATGGYQTIWGVPVTTDQQSGLAIAPP